MAADTDTQKYHADENDFADILENMTSKMTKLITEQMNLRVQTVEKDTWQGVMTMKWNKKKE